jgi:hypothetical protein
VALAVAVVAAGYGSGTGEDTGASSGVATRTPPTPVDTRGLLTGLAEANPHLIAPAARPPAGFEVARDRVAALRPEFFRLLVDWSKLQPSAGAAPDLAAPVDGCARGRAPCAASDGLREQLRAVKARQEADGGWRVVVTLYGTPAWAAAPAAACEREGTEPRSRMPDLRAYRGLVRALQDLARAEGVELELWSPWNEPNHPYFLSPQRARCAGDAPPLAPARYARLVRCRAAARPAARPRRAGRLRPAPGHRRLRRGVHRGAAARRGVRPRAVGAAHLRGRARPRRPRCLRQRPGRGGQR